MKFHGHCCSFPAALALIEHDFAVCACVTKQLNKQRRAVNGNDGNQLACLLRQLLICPEDKNSGSTSCPLHCLTSAFYAFFPSSYIFTNSDL